MSTSLPRLSRSAQSTALDDFIQHALPPAKLPASSCSFSSSFFHARIPVHLDRLSQSCASDTSDPAPSVSSHRWHAPTRRMRWVFVQEMSTRAQLSLVRFDAHLCLAPSQSAPSFLSRWGVISCERKCMARFQSRVRFGILAAIAPISLGPSSRFADRSMMRLESML